MSASPSRRTVRQKHRPLNHCPYKVKQRLICNIQFYSMLRLSYALGLQQHAQIDAIFTTGLPINRY